MPFDRGEGPLHIRPEPIRLVEYLGVVAVAEDHPPPGGVTFRTRRPSKLRREERLPTPLGDLRDVTSAGVRGVAEDDSEGGLDLSPEGREHRDVRHVGRHQRPRVDLSPSFPSALADDMELAELVDREPPSAAEREPLPSRVLPEPRRVRRNRSNSSARVTEVLLNAASTFSLSSLNHSSEHRRCARPRVMREGASFRPIWRRMSEATQSSPSA